MTFQETKIVDFDISYIKNFCPKRFNQFIHFPSSGSSGGLITIWNGNVFSGSLVSKDYYQITIELTSKLAILPGTLLMCMGQTLLKKN